MSYNNQYPGPSQHPSAQNYNQAYPPQQTQQHPVTPGNANIPGYPPPQQGHYHNVQAHHTPYGQSSPSYPQTHQGAAPYSSPPQKYTYQQPPYYAPQTQQPTYTGTGHPQAAPYIATSLPPPPPLPPRVASSNNVVPYSQQQPLAAAAQSVPAASLYPPPPPPPPPQFPLLTDTLAQSMSAMDISQPGTVPTPQSSENTAQYSYTSSAVSPPQLLPQPDLQKFVSPVQQPQAVQFSQPQTVTQPIVQPQPVQPVQPTQKTTQTTQTTQTQQPRQQQRRGPKPPKLIRESGPHSDVLLECPETTKVDFSTHWYRTPEVPGFLICSACYAEHIQNTSLQQHFERFQQPEGVPSQCRFWLPRVKNVLWPAAIQSSSMDALVTFMKKRLAIPDCKGLESSKNDSGIQWFSAKNNQIPTLTICEACYEDWILAAPLFSDQFGPPDLPQRMDEMWKCHLSIPGIVRALKEYSKPEANSWSHFVILTKRRLELPAACTGEVVEAAKSKWFALRDNIEDMVFCETCFIDKVVLTEFHPRFEPHQPPAQHPDPNQRSKPVQYSCDMASLPMQMALGSSLRLHDYKTFWSAANIIMKAPPCNGHATNRGVWFTLSSSVGGPIDNWMICSACHAGIMMPLGMGKFFSRIHTKPTDNVLCDIGPGNPRAAASYMKLVVTQLVGVFTPFVDYIKTFSDIPVCQKRTQIKDATWYGWPDVYICPDCYQSLVVHSPLKTSLLIEAVVDPRPSMCCLYSPRMQNLWKSSCEKGSADEFVAFARHRQKVYNAVMPTIEGLKKIRELKMVQAVNQASYGFTMQAMAGMKVMSGAVPYLNGGTGLTWESHAAKNYFAQSQQGMQNATMGDELGQIMQLEMKWAEVE